MATTPVVFFAPPGKTLTVDLFPYGSDSVAASGKAATEATNRKGLYSISVTETISGWHTAHILESGVVIGVYSVYMEDDTDVHRCEDAPMRLYDGGDGIALVQALSSTERSALAAAILDLADGVETDWTVRHALRIVLSAAAAKLAVTDAGATNTFRDVGDSKNRIVATVDANGQRTAVSYTKT